MFDRIVAGFEDRLAAATPPDAEAEARDDDAGRYDVGILYGPSDPPELRARERRALWRHGRRAIWPSREAAAATIAASDHWVHRTLSIVPYGEVGPEELPRYNIHVHAYYTDGFAEDLARSAAWRHAARVVATTDTAAKAAVLAAAGRAAGVALETRVVANRGRDILPFLALFQGDEDDNEIWCHVHLKKSVGLGPTSPGEVWRRFLMRILLGETASGGARTGQPERLSAAPAILRAPHVGLVGAFDPYIMGWTGSRRLLPQLAARLDTFEGHEIMGDGFQGGGTGRPLPDHPLLFPVGNMFWAKAGVVNAMRALFGTDYPWPNEPIAGDGTVFHLIERLWPTAAALSGRDSVFLDKADERRV